MINLIASVGRNNELGKDGNLIWAIKNDLKFFRDVTIDHDIIMGRRTFESLPRLLDRRRHIVLTRGNYFCEGVEVAYDVKSLILRYEDKDAFVIGGASIYEQFVEYSEKIYLTEIDDTCLSADTFFPFFDKGNFVREVIKENYDNELKYDFVLYKRRH